MIPLTYYLIFSSILFCIGVYGVLARRNSILILVSIELMLNAVNINLIAFSAFIGGSEVIGQIFSLFAVAVGAGEIGVALAIILNLYRLRNTINIDQIDFLKW
ncbi:MAG: NADH-quinone oxidoreductase subunit NuoK [bacterium]